MRLSWVGMVLAALIGTNQVVAEVSREGQKMKRCAVSVDTIRVEAPFDMPLLEVPVFPDSDFVITAYGAEEGGSADCTRAIADAVAACHEAGGGRVVVPAGRWLTGPVHLKSYVDLHIEEGATLVFKGDPESYLPAVRSSWEGMECYNYSPLIYAFECTDVAVTGRGTLSPVMDVWAKWFTRPATHMAALKELYTMAAEGVPVERRQMARGENNMRPHFLQFNRCRRVLVEDVKIRNSPFWTIHLLLCDGAVVRRVDIRAHGHNNDGVDPEMSRNVLIEHCIFDQGDDAIAIKSGADRDGRRLNTPTENLVMRHCTMRNGHQLVAIGSELSGGIRNVYVHDCVFENEPDDRPQNLMFIKTNVRRGGYVENVWLENITANSTRYGVLGVDTDVLYQWRDLVPTYEEVLTRIEGIHVRNIRLGECAVPFRLLGDARLPIRDVEIENVVVGKVTGEPRVYKNAENVREKNISIGGSEK